MTEPNPAVNVQWSDDCRASSPLKHVALGDEANMVCISAASSGRLVMMSKISKLEDSLVRFTSSDPSRTYRDLRLHFQRIARAEAQFHVDARPDERIDNTILAT